MSVDLPIPSEIDSLEDVVSPPGAAGIFENSSVVLSSPIDQPSRSMRNIAIAQPLAELLKDHQIDGIKFMWRNCFSDLAFVDATDEDCEGVGGCILAHVSHL